MKARSIALTLATAWLASACAASAPELPPFGQIPDIEKKWKLRDQEKYGDSTFVWNWIVLTNSENGDVLSFAAHRFEPGEEHGTNRMAHGYALVFDDVAVLVQHMSMKPIASEFAHGMAVSLLNSRSRKSVSGKPQSPVKP